MRTLLGMQYGGNAQQQYPRRQLQLQPQSFQEGGGVSSGLAALLRGQKKRLASDAALGEIFPALQVWNRAW